MRADELRLLRGAVERMSVLDLLELLVVVRVELERRGDRCAANYVQRAATAHAAFSISLDAPSDNGPRAPGDSGADV
jgi:hypothetical protein